jgi:hypothetical protein
MLFKEIIVYSESRTKAVNTLVVKTQSQCILKQVVKAGGTNKYQWVSSVKRDCISIYKTEVTHDGYLSYFPTFPLSYHFCRYPKCTHLPWRNLSFSDQWCEKAVENTVFPLYILPLHMSVQQAIPSPSETKPFISKAVKRMNIIITY